MSEKVWARRQFTYARVARALGEVFELTGAVNDEILLRLRYVDPVKKGLKLYEHGETGRKFLEAGFLEAFGRQYAKAQEQIRVAQLGSLPGEGTWGLDVTGDAEESRLNRAFPLALDKTKAEQR